jgi:hypothetical protein
MRLNVSVAHEFAVLAGDVARPKEWRFRVADYRVRRNVAVNVQEIQAAVYVKRLLAIVPNDTGSSKIVLRSKPM